MKIWLIEPKYKCNLITEMLSFGMKRAAALVDVTHYI